MKRILVALTYATFLVSAQSNAWTGTENFENGSVGAQVFHIYKNTTHSKDFVHSGKHAGKTLYTAGSTGESSGGNYTFPTKLSNGDEFWFRAYFYFPADFNFRANPVSKMMRVKNGAGHTSLLWYSDGSVGGSNELNESSFVRNNSNWNSFFTLTKGKWEAVEMYVKFSPAAGDGIFRVWHNGKLVLEDTKTPTIVSGYQVPGSFYGSYWNGGSPKSQSMYVDDIVWTSDTPSNRDSSGNPFIGTGRGNSGSAPAPTPKPSPPIPPKLNQK